MIIGTFTLQGTFEMLFSVCMYAILQKNLGVKGLKEEQQQFVSS